MVLTNHMHLLPVSYNYVKEEIYFSKVIQMIIQFLLWVLVHKSDEGPKNGLALVTYEMYLCCV